MSLVLNDRPGVRIAGETRRRVLEVARRLGYQEPSNGGARTSTLNSIAYVLGTGDQQPARMVWHFGMLDEVQRCVGDDDRCVVYASTNDTAAAVAKVLRTLDRAEPLGAILDGTVPEPLVVELQKRRLPFVINGITPFSHESRWAGQVDTVSIDIQRGVRQLMEWLASHGGRSIAFSCVGLHLLVNRLILQAYQDAVRELDLVYHPGLVQVCSADADGKHLLSRYRELGVEYDGLLIGSPSLAYTTLASSAVEKARGDGARPPLVAVIGPGGADEPAPPDAATVYIRHSECARLAYDLLSLQIRHPERKPQNVAMQMTFHDPTRAYDPHPAVPRLS